MAEEKPGFLARWSQRKREQKEIGDDRQAGEAGANAGESEAEAARHEAERAEEEARRIEAERAELEGNRLAAEAVDLEKVAYGDDFSIFLKRGVSDLLRKKALRKFFTSNPLLANLDGLNDYDEDFNNPAHKVYKSSWDVARGFLTKSEDALQKATGGLSALSDEREEAQGDESGMPEAGDEENLQQPEEAAGDASAEAASAEVTASQEADAAVGKAARQTTGEADGETAEPAASRRVSIRKRLEG